MSVEYGAVVLFLVRSVRYDHVVDGYQFPLSPVTYGLVARGEPFEPGLAGPFTESQSQYFILASANSCMLAFKILALGDDSGKIM